MEYEVDFKTTGRGGWVYYHEDGVTLPFDWDVTPVGFDIYLPVPSEWDAFLNEHNANRLKGRRQVIVERIAKQVNEQKAQTARVAIDDSGISFSFERNWFHNLMRRVLGV